MFRRHRKLDDFGAEVSAHLEHEIARLREQGLTEEEAHAAARRSFGNVTKAHERFYESTRWLWWDQFCQDVRYGLRMLRKSPGFTAVAVLTLALGIGANTAIFSLVDCLVLRPLPIVRPDQVVFLMETRKGGDTRTAFSYPHFQEIAEQTSNIFSEVTASQPYSMDGVSGDGKSQPIWTSYVSGNFFEALGVKPALGRLILPSEGKVAGANPILVLSYAYWKSAFDGDPNIIGKKLTVNKQPVTVVGVAPEGFRGLTSLLDTQGYIPLGMAGTLKDAAPNFLTAYDFPTFAVVARLRPGVDARHANTALQVVANRLARDHPGLATVESLRVLPLGPTGLAINPGHPETLALVSTLFLSLAGSVLVLACVNIANLLLVRAGNRQREMAMRAALGATRARLIRHLLTESILLGTMGGFAGLVLGLIASYAVGSIPLRTSLPVVLDFSFDWRVFAYALGAALLTGTIIGIAPALRAARGNVNEILHEGGRTSTAASHRVRNALVAAQVGGSLMLLIVAGLFVRSLEHIEHSDLGFDQTGVLNLSLDPHEAGYDEQQTREFFQNLLQRARSLPGVQSASLATSVPMGYYNSAASLTIEGYEPPAGERAPHAGYNEVSPGYFQTMRIAFLRGRDFSDADSPISPSVAIINQVMAERYWRGLDPIGRHFISNIDPRHPLQIVGIVRNIRPASYVGTDATSYFYVPLVQSSQLVESIATLQVRTTAAPEAMARDVTSLVHSLEPAMPVFDVQPMSAALETLNGFLLFQFAAGLAGSLGLLGLVLAVVGVYGVISYAASQRTHEIGIRLALGAHPARVLRMIFGHGCVIVMAGVLVGLAAAAGMAKVVGNFLVGVRPLDPITYSGASLFLGLTAFLACYIPARRAMRVEPMVALRHE